MQHVDDALGEEEFNLRLDVLRNFHEVLSVLRGQNDTTDAGSVGGKDLVLDSTHWRRRGMLSWRDSLASRIVFQPSGDRVAARR